MEEDEASAPRITTRSELFLEAKICVESIEKLSLFKFFYLSFVIKDCISINVIIPQ